MFNRLVFKKIASPEPAAAYVFEELRSRLAGGKAVLWLVAGGSVIDVAVLAAKKLRRIADLTNLIVTLTDERWGRPGHPDSNWRQLAEKGFKLPGAQLAPVLNGKNLVETAADYGDFLTTTLTKADYSLALAGIGPDGHTFGIFPGSPALQSDQPVIGYKWQDYDRLTPTAKLLKQLNEVVIYAVGESKWPQLAKLKDELPAAQQPAQLLKSASRVVLFNDYKGGNE